MKGASLLAFLLFFCSWSSASYFVDFRELELKKNTFYSEVLLSDFDLGDLISIRLNDDSNSHEFCELSGLYTSENKVQISTESLLWDLITAPIFQDTENGKLVFLLDTEFGFLLLKVPFLNGTSVLKEPEIEIMKEMNLTMGEKHRNTHEEVIWRLDWANQNVLIIIGDEMFLVEVDLVNFADFGDWTGTPSKLRDFLSLGVSDFKFSSSGLFVLYYEDRIDQYSLNERQYEFQKAFYEEKNTIGYSDFYMQVELFEEEDQLWALHSAWGLDIFSIKTGKFIGNIEIKNGLEFFRYEEQILLEVGNALTGYHEIICVSYDSGSFSSYEILQSIEDTGVINSMFTNNQDSYFFSRNMVFIINNDLDLTIAQNSYFKWLYEYVATTDLRGASLLSFGDSSDSPQFILVSNDLVSLTKIAKSFPVLSCVVDKSNDFSEFLYIYYNVVGEDEETGIDRYVDVIKVKKVVNIDGKLLGSAIGTFVSSLVLLLVCFLCQRKVRKAKRDYIALLNEEGKAADQTDIKLKGQKLDMSTTQEQFRSEISNKVNLDEISFNKSDISMLCLETKKAKRVPEEEELVDETLNVDEALKPPKDEDKRRKAAMLSIEISGSKKEEVEMSKKNSYGSSDSNENSLKKRKRK